MALKKKSKRSKRSRKRPSVGLPVGVLKKPKEVLQLPSEGWWTKALFPFVLFGIVLVYSYWPTLEWMVSAWINEPDYSHGFVVIPLACLMLMHRWEKFPGFRVSVSYEGLSLVALAILMRLSSRLIYADFLDAWSMIPLVAGIVWFLFGFAAMRWALPAICFLIFMFPMPYQAETMLSWKLQGVATELSTFMLRVLGQPAVSEGHIVWLYGEQLLIEQACSGLRIFVGVGALAYFWSAIADRSPIDRVVLLAAAIPMAIVANSIRITTIGLLYGWFDDASSRRAIHDFTGLAMIPLAFVLLWLFKRYWELLYRPLAIPTAKDFLPTID